MVNRVLLKIRLLRLEKKYSQEYIALRMNISQSYYGRIENGKTTLSIKRLLQLLVILETDCAAFFNDLEEVNIFEVSYLKKCYLKAIH